MFLFEEEINKSVEIGAVYVACCLISVTRVRSIGRRSFKLSGFKKKRLQLDLLSLLHK